MTIKYTHVSVLLGVVLVALGMLLAGLPTVAKANTDASLEEQLAFLLDQIQMLEQQLEVPDVTPNRSYYDPETRTTFNYYYTEGQTLQLLELEESSMTDVMHGFDLVVGKDRSESFGFVSLMRSDHEFFWGMVDLVFAAEIEEGKSEFEADFGIETTFERSVVETNGLTMNRYAIVYEGEDLMAALTMSTPVHEEVLLTGVVFYSNMPELATDDSIPDRDVAEKLLSTFAHSLEIDEDSLLEVMEEKTFWQP